MTWQAVQGAASAVQRALVAVMKVVCVFTGAVMVVLVMLGVFYRYMLGSSLAYATALPTVLFPYFIMSGAILAAKEGAHLNVDYVLLRMPDIARRWIPFVTKVLVVAVFGFVAVVSIDLLPTLARRTMPLLGWPASWAFYSLPLGFGGLALYTLIEALADLIPGSAESREES